MATVYFSSGLARYTDGLETVAIDAPRVRELKLALANRFPRLGEQLEHMAVAINGRIHTDADYEVLDPAAEIHFVPRIAGG